MSLVYVKARLNIQNMELLANGLSLISTSIMDQMINNDDNNGPFLQYQTCLYSSSLPLSYWHFITHNDHERLHLLDEVTFLFISISFLNPSRFRLFLSPIAHFITLYEKYHFIILQFTKVASPSSLYLSFQFFMI